MIVIGALSFIAGVIMRSTEDYQLKSRYPWVNVSDGFVMAADIFFFIGILSILVGAIWLFYSRMKKSGKDTTKLNNIIQQFGNAVLTSRNSEGSFCENCGARMSDGAAFCSGCGTKSNVP
jgi:ribosomal protein L40E